MQIYQLFAHSPADLKIHRRSIDFVQNLTGKGDVTHMKNISGILIWVK